MFFSSPDMLVLLLVSSACTLRLRIDLGQRGYFSIKRNTIAGTVKVSRQQWFNLQDQHVLEFPPNLINGDGATV